MPRQGGRTEIALQPRRHVSAVKRVDDFILTGDVFQVNIARRFRAKLPSSFDPLAFYRQVRSLNPAPFAALLRYGNLTFSSSLPF
ncbi:chorismate-binding protein [Bradyrhizobium sp. CCBAU 11386]|uniref:chorismate-binding protein n=1 Tax=Bradyrhizobium sp. CCBAU 11386 TaxID=1630837 RepID=UPI002302D975|nr:chorismate-binding protein [Bradyrhizobium sp. CCBAU 11386]